MTEPIKLTGVSRIKATQAEQFLKDRAGIVILGDNGIFIGVKSPHVIFLNIAPESDLQLSILGICGKESEKRIIEQTLHSFEAATKNKFSQRDLNIGLFQDFLMWHLGNLFYNKKVERVLATEFILAQLTRGEMRVALIRYNGDLQTLNNHSEPAIIGCYDGKTQKEVLKNFDKIDFSKQTAKQLNKLGRLALKRFTGKLATGLFQFEPAKTQAQSRRASKKK